MAKAVPHKCDYKYKPYPLDIIDLIAVQQCVLFYVFLKPCIDNGQDNVVECKKRIKHSAYSIQPKTVSRAPRVSSLFHAFQAGAWNADCISQT